MRKFLTVLTAVPSIFRITGAGVLLRKINRLSEDEGRPVSRWKEATRSSGSGFGGNAVGLAQR